MGEIDRIRSRLQSLENAKPDKDEDPEGFRKANDRISREIDISRLWRAAEKRSGVV